MRIILKETSDRQLFAALIGLRSKHISTNEGAIMGNDGLVHVTDKDAPKALEVLTHLGFSAQAG